MHVEIEDRYPLQAMRLERLSHADRHVVEDAEAHGGVAFRVMTGRPHAAEGAPGLAAHQEIHGEHVRAGGAQRGFERIRAHRRVRVEVHQAFGRHPGREPLDVPAWMNTRELFERGPWCLVMHEEIVEPPGVQLFLDGGEACRPLRMPRPHVVQPAGRVRNERHRHQDSGCCDSG